MNSAGPAKDACRHVGVLADAFDAYVEVFDKAAERAGFNAEEVQPEAVSGFAELLESFSDPDLYAQIQKLAALRKRVDAVIAVHTAEMEIRAARVSRSQSQPCKLGFSSSANLIETALGVTRSEAKRFLQTGAGVANRRAISGELLPAENEHVRSALDGTFDYSRSGAKDAGEHDADAPSSEDGANTESIGVAAAEAIIQFTREMRGRADWTTIADGERTLVEQARELTLQQLRKSIAHLKATIDPDGVEPREARQIEERSLRIRTDSDGMTCISARLDPLSAAPVVTAIEHLVTQHYRGREDAKNEPEKDAASPGSRVRFVLSEPIPSCGETGEAHPGPVSTTERTHAQLLVDALVMLCEHALGCNEDALPRASTQVVVRMDLEDLVELNSSNPLANVEGFGPISATQLRILSAKSDLIPMVLGTNGEVLDLGKKARHYTSAQRIALLERDGGCAFCGLPASMTEAHHIRWWEKHGGTTDLENGVLLCTTCHHRVHEGWDVEISDAPGGGTVWFFLPGHIDLERTPRIGGRKRFDPGFRMKYPAGPPPVPAWSAHDFVRKRVVPSQDASGWLPGAA